MPHPSEKPCKTCGITTPLTEFYFSKGMSDRHKNVCKACHKEKFRQYRKDNARVLREYDKGRDATPQRKAQHRKNYHRNKRNRPLTKARGLA